MGAGGVTHEPIIETPVGFDRWPVGCSRFSPHPVQSPVAAALLHLGARLHGRVRDEEVTMAPNGDIGRLTRGLYKIQDIATERNATSDQ